ncbi:MAG: hypothetical protein A4E34_00672 [Methanoregula sp. PtaU1.Bin006]|jgi:hypothetical protein|nr:MAG: hypothetical protein A4E34_00672 [Methanoregula sp. PtaU1.Bin006]
MKTGYKIVLTTDRTLMSEYSGEPRDFPLEKTILRTLLKCGTFLSLRKIRACESSLRAGRSFKFGKNTFQIFNPVKLTSVIRTYSSRLYEKRI